MLLLTILQYIIDAAATVLGGALLLRFWMQAVLVRPPSTPASPCAWRLWTACAASCWSAVSPRLWRAACAWATSRPSPSAAQKEVKEQWRRGGGRYRKGR